MNRLLIAAVSLIGLAAPASAQSSLDVKSGDWVRIETAHSRKVQGKLIKIDTDSVILAADNRSTNRIVLARSAVTSFAVSVGQKRQTKRGILIGAGLGAAIAAVWRAATWKPCTAPPEEPFACIFEEDSNRGTEVAAAGVTGGLIGGLIGGSIGFRLRSHIWGDTRMPASVGFAPAGRGAVAPSLRLQITFYGI